MYGNENKCLGNVVNVEMDGVIIIHKINKRMKLSEMKLLLNNNKTQTFLSYLTISNTNSNNNIHTCNTCYH